MSIGLNIKIDVDGLDKFQKHIEYIKKLDTSKSDTKFQKYLQKKCMDALNNIMNQRLRGGTTNDDAISLYRSSNHLVELDDGFIIYNDAKVQVEGKSADNYPNGEFSIALAFEYGTGITGEGTYQNDFFQSWDYNINNYNFGWYYNKDGQINHTYGYMGFEIYRYTAEEIKSQLPKWVNEYFKKDGGVSQ